jgi:hypothetical protein
MNDSSQNSSLSFNDNDKLMHRVFGGDAGAVNILAIESSCDDTSAAVCRDGVILSNQIASQSIHEKYGGVVPELASRAHLQNIVPVVDAALQSAGVTLQHIDAVAFTQAPGLIGALLVGAQFAKSLALALDLPLHPEANNPSPSASTTTAEKRCITFVCRL